MKKKLRCKQCGRIITGDKKIALCEKCRKNDGETAVGIATVAGIGSAAFYKFRKPLGEFAKKGIEVALKAADKL